MLAAWGGGGGCMLGCWGGLRGGVTDPDPAPPMSLQVEEREDGAAEAERPGQHAGGPGKGERCWGGIRGTPLQGTPGAETPPPTFHTPPDSHQTQNIMYDMVSELQERNEDLEKRLGALESKMEALGLSLLALPGLVSQALGQQQRELLGSWTPRLCSATAPCTPTRTPRSPSTAPPTSSDSG